MTETTPPSLDDVRDAFDEGDLARARLSYEQIDPEPLSDGDIDDYERLGALLRPDPAAIGLAVTLGLGLVAISIALFV